MEGCESGDNTKENVIEENRFKCLLEPFRNVYIQSVLLLYACSLKVKIVRHIFGLMQIFVHRDLVFQVDESFIEVFHSFHIAMYA